MFTQPPALLYHKVDPRWEAGVTWVTPSVFRRQMERLAEAGWKTILPDLNQVKQKLPPPSSAGGESKGGVSIDNNHFHLIFDDGYEGIYHHAFPVLEELGFKASVFIPSGYIGKMNDWDHQLLGRRFRHLSVSMLNELSAAGWMIGSHGVSHTDLSGEGDKQLRNELSVSRSMLQDIIGFDIKWLSFPFGRYGRRVIDAAVDAGYSGAVVPVLRSSVDIPDYFSILEADAVYSWDTPGMVLKRLRRGSGYRLGRGLRMVMNSFSLGTVIWKRRKLQAISNK